MKTFLLHLALLLLALPALAMQQTPPDVPPADELLDKYTPVRLTTDLGALSENERRMIPLLIDAAEAMDRIFAVQAHGDLDSLKSAVAHTPSEQILRLQGDGDYDAVAAFVERYGTLGEPLQKDLDRLAAAGIPVDIVYEQGMSVLEETSE